MNARVIDFAAARAARQPDPEDEGMSREDLARMFLEDLIERGWAYEVESMLFDYLHNQLRWRRKAPPGDGTA